MIIQYLARRKNNLDSITNQLKVIRSHGLWMLLEFLHHIRLTCKNTKINHTVSASLNKIQMKHLKIYNLKHQSFRLLQSKLKLINKKYKEFHR